ncbi:MAG: hypothetical protein BWZ10_01195 [candidate division BRC1 bacterium ADurb.BinA364]|nr:MAG: hypothetical protein BWZ10_01195 [candidate division BRC1 bacterium ADurb.BinA364]
MARFSVFAIAAWLCALAAFEAAAAPEPRDVFREYAWRPEGKWQRITWPDVEEPRARAHLPNAVNTITIGDLDQAIEAEACVELLLCHGGTVGKKMRVNGHEWIDIPESPLIPGDRGRGGSPPAEYQTMRYPLVPIPLEQLIEGPNTFEFTVGPGTNLGKWWPQNILYGVVFRIYYGPEKKAIQGRIVSPAPGAALGDKPEIVVETDDPAAVARVDVIGKYKDFDWEGDGEFRQWHYRFLYGEIQSHIGSAFQAPFRVEWNTDWIPSQPEPFELAARVIDGDGLCSITPAVGGLSFKRSFSVRMGETFDVPPRWSTRAGKTQQCKTLVTGGLSQAIEAKIVMCTWNGDGAEAIGVNGEKLVDKVGLNHDLSYDEIPVPVEKILPGENTLYTYSGTEHHGIEVQWPGMVLLIRDAIPE